MGQTRALFVAFAVSLLVGYITSQTVDAMDSARSPPPSVTVPSGRLGDAVTYVVDRKQEGWYGVPWSTNRTFTLPLHIGPVTTTKDRAGNSHEVLEVRVRDHAQFIDLDTRDLIYQNFPIDLIVPAEHPLDAVAILGEKRQYGWTYLGPVCFPAANMWRNGLAFGGQGRTFQVGDDLSRDLEAKELECRQHEATFYGIDSIADARIRSSMTVDEAGYIGGDLAVRLRTSVNVSVLSPHGDWWYSWATDLWYTAASPYPPLATYRFETLTPQESMLETEVWVLGSVDAGTEPIPWGRCEGEHYARGNTGLARHTGPHRFPVSTGSGLSLGLEDAWPSARNDPTLVGFQEWQENHPDHFLAGAIGRETGNDAGLPAFTWTLLVGSLSGEGYGIAATKAGDVRLNRDLGPARVRLPPDFDTTQLPRHPVTLGEVERVWREEVRSDVTNVRPNFVAWGRWQDLEPNATLRGIFNYDRFASVTFGYQDLDAPQSVGQAKYDLIRFNIEAGTLAAHSQGRGTLAAVSPAIAEPPPAIQQAPGAARGSAPQVIALTSVPLLLLFLIAYFYPLLKFAATTALTWLPGFTRLQSTAILDHRARSRVYDLVREEPGISPPEAMNRLGIPWSTLIYHLSVLEKRKLISSLVDGRHKRFFPTETIDWSRRGQLAALRNVKTKHAYEHILSEPGIFQKELSQRLRVTPTAAAWHLQRLLAAGLVGRDRVGRKVCYYAAPPVTIGPAPAASMEVA